jgi:hypothetical protein
LRGLAADARQPAELRDQALERGREAAHGVRRVPGS